MTDSKTLTGVGGMEMPPLRPGLGNDLFKVFITDPQFYVDKTLFIKEFIEEKSTVQAILRPRRFGKSLNLTMLQSFFAFGADREDFKSFEIFKESDTMEDHCGKYPVIYLNFKGCKADTWNDMLYLIGDSIEESLEDHDLTYEDFHMDRYHPIQLSTTLKKLLKRLFKAHGQKAIVLIDEYDTPLNEAFRNGFYPQASKFFGSFYGALKSCPYLKKACIMGIVEVRGAGIMSGLNNLRIFSLACEQYSQYFGFTEQEITKYAANDLAKVLQWYNGYTIGKTKVVNPWSFCSWYLEKEFDTFWLATSSSETLSKVLPLKQDQTLLTELNMLITDPSYTVEVSLLKTAVSYGSEKWLDDSIWHFMVNVGYLTYEHKPGSTTGSVFIPNKEVRDYWIMELFAILEVDEMKIEMKTALENSHHDAMGKSMRSMVECASCFDFIRENSYHMLFLGCFLILYGSANVTSNLESGFGRYDIRIVINRKKTIVIFEFKRSDSSTAMQKDAKIALKQIDDKKPRPGWKYLKIGVSFHQKEMSRLEYQVEQY